MRQASLAAAHRARSLRRTRRHTNFKFTMLELLGSVLRRSAPADADAAARLLASSVTDDGALLIEHALAPSLTPELSALIARTLFHLGRLRRLATLVALSRALVAPLLDAAAASTEVAASGPTLRLLAPLLLGWQHSPELCAAATPCLMRVLEVHLVAPRGGDGNAAAASVQLLALCEAYTYLHRECTAATAPLSPLVDALRIALGAAAPALSQRSAVALLREHAWVREEGASSAGSDNGEAETAAAATAAKESTANDTLPWFEGLWTTSGPRSAFELALRATAPCAGSVVATSRAAEVGFAKRREAASTSSSSSGVLMRAVHGKTASPATTTTTTTTSWIVGHLHTNALSGAVPSSEADSSAALSVQLSGWECPHCTMRNPTTRTTCEACTRERPSLDVSEKESGVAWVPFRASFESASADVHARDVFVGTTFDHGKPCAFRGRRLRVTTAFDVTSASCSTPSEALSSPTVYGAFTHRLVSSTGARFLLAGAVAQPAQTATSGSSAALMLGGTAIDSHRGVVLSEDPLAFRGGGFETSLRMGEGGCAVHFVRSSFWAITSSESHARIAAPHDPNAPLLLGASTAGVTTATNPHKCLTICVTRSSVKGLANITTLRVEVYLRDASGATALLGVADELGAFVKPQEHGGDEEAMFHLRLGKRSISLVVQSTASSGEEQEKVLLQLPVNASAALSMDSEEKENSEGEPGRLPLWLALSSVDGVAKTPSTAVEQWSFRTLDPVEATAADDDAEIAASATAVGCSATNGSTEIVYFPDDPDTVAAAGSSGSSSGASASSSSSAPATRASTSGGATASKTTAGSLVSFKPITAVVPPFNAERRAAAIDLAEMMGRSVDLCEFVLGEKNDNKEAALNAMFEDMDALQVIFVGFHITGRITLCTTYN